MKETIEDQSNEEELSPAERTNVPRGEEGHVPSLSSKLMLMWLFLIGTLHYIFSTAAKKNNSREFLSQQTHVMYIIGE